jgi:hypothetical protein
MAALKVLSIPGSRLSRRTNRFNYGMRNYRREKLRSFQGSKAIEALRFS